MNEFTDFATLKSWAPGTFVAFIILMMLTDQLVLKYRLSKVEKQRDKWQELALELLGVASKMTAANETAVETLDKRLPPPDLVSEAIKKMANSNDDESEGGGLREAARMAAEAAAKRLRG